MMKRLARMWEEPEDRAKLLFRLWLISTGFTMFGFAVMFYLVVFAHR